VLKRGEIELAGNPGTLAVTGGTGTYQNACGQTAIKGGPARAIPPRSRSPCSLSGVAKWRRRARRLP